MIFNELINKLNQVAQYQFVCPYCKHHFFVGNLYFDYITKDFEVHFRCRTCNEKGNVRI